MGFFKKLFSSSKTIGEKNALNRGIPAASAAPAPPVNVPEDDYSRLGLTVPIADSEKELVSVIASAVLAGDNPNAKIRVKSVVGINTEKEIAGIVACAVASGANPNSKYRIVSITEIN